MKARNDDSEDRVFEDKGFFAKGPEFSRVTPDWITSLDGSALQGLSCTQLDRKNILAFV